MDTIQDLNIHNSKDMGMIEMLFTTIRGGVCVWDLENDGRILYSTLSLLRFFNISKEKITSLNIRSFQDLIYSEDRDFVKTHIERQLRRGGAYKAEYRIYLSDGKKLWVREISRRAVTTNNKMVLFCVFLDISDEKNKEYQMTIDRQSTEDEFRLSSQKLKSDIKALEKELESSRIKVMMNQMQPHFLYNALSSIRTIVKVNPDYAYDLIYDFATYLRANVKALSSEEPIKFEEEINNIKAYLAIEKMRFGDRLRIVFETDKVDFNVIPLSIQPLVENAVRHGIYQRGKCGGTVLIKSYEEEEDYIIIVKDDGVGFDFDAIIKNNKDSVGLKSLIFRLGTILGANVYVDSEEGIGTKVEVRIPKDT